VEPSAIGPPASPSRDDIAPAASLAISDVASARASAAMRIGGSSPIRLSHAAHASDHAIRIAQTLAILLGPRFMPFICSPAVSLRA
jgi:hypothetical protein